VATEFSFQIPTVSNFLFTMCETAYPDITYGADVPDRITSDKMEKKMKKIVKEGGKRGVEIEGAADMGGLQFFCTAMDEPNGDVDLLYESMKAMNEKSDPSEEERKGGSGRIGKLIISKNQEDSKLALVAYCPPSKHDVLKADQWMTVLLKTLGAGTMSFGDAYTAKAEILNDPDKGVYILKVKDAAITEGINYLKSKGLFPDKTDDSDDDYVFGDDDFPTADGGYEAAEEPVAEAPVDAAKAAQDAEDAAKAVKRAEIMAKVAAAQAERQKAGAYEKAQEEKKKEIEEKGTSYYGEHAGITCDACATVPIFGYRYLCKSCASHDICESCYDAWAGGSGSMPNKLAKQTLSTKATDHSFTLFKDKTLKSAVKGGGGPTQKSEPKLKPNDNCSCGSGKKFKKCCMNSALAAPN